MAKKHTTRCPGCKAFHKPNIEVCPRCGLELNEGADNGDIKDNGKRAREEESAAEKEAGTPARAESAAEAESRTDDAKGQDTDTEQPAAKDSGWSIW